VSRRVYFDVNGPEYRKDVHLSERRAILKEGCVLPSNARCISKST
jgi:hypothetical protein